MINFKLNKLLTVSLFAFGVSGTAIHGAVEVPGQSGGIQTAPSSENTAQLTPAQERAQTSVKLLMNKAKSGDPSAEKVVKDFNLDLTSDPDTIKKAIVAYRVENANRHKPSTATSEATPMATIALGTPTEPQQPSKPLTPSMRSSLNQLINKANSGDEVAAKVVNEFGLTENSDFDTVTKAFSAYRTANASRHMPSAAKTEVMAPPTKALSEDCVAEVGKYKQKIIALETDLESARLAAQAGGKIGAGEQKIYDDLDTFLKTDPILVYKKVKELLESLLSTNDSELAITKFLSVVTNHQGSDARGEKISNIYIKLNEEGVLKDYFKTIMRKELQGAQVAINRDGDKVLALLPSQPDLKFLMQNPLMMICYTDKDKAKGFWLSNNLKTYKQFIVSTKPGDLKAVYAFLTKKWKLRHPIDVVTTTPLEDFLISIYEQIGIYEKPGSRTRPIPLKLSSQQVEDFIKDRIKTDLPVDYAKLEQENLKYEMELRNIIMAFSVAIEKNPFLKILKLKDFAAWQEMNFDRSTYERMIAFFQYCSLYELKAILFRLSKNEITTKGDLNEQYFYKALNDEVKAREAKKEINSPQKITSSTKSEMNRIVAKIDPTIPTISEPTKAGAGAPPPPPPPPHQKTPPTPPKAPPLTRM